VTPGSGRLERERGRGRGHVDRDVHRHRGHRHALQFGGVVEQAPIARVRNRQLAGVLTLNELAAAGMGQRVRGAVAIRWPPM
jgi:hypothetical protein